MSAEGDKGSAPFTAPPFEKGGRKLSIFLVECVYYELVDGVAEGVHIGGAVDAAREDDLVAGQLFYDRFDGLEDLFASDERFGKVECAHIVKSLAEVEDSHRFKRGAVLCGVDGICVARGDKVVAR